ncbi:putative adenylyltransferase/sulfurtransferase MoeZ [Mariprofundus micogutta]|uniref:Putative adenylyltransferase/sulfurtransferase MoeZ n=1 Tax=Mariprofundus micogutta TaxID=1921010 RepID=A0A1L8CPX5_9PROT|nr:rhodanese-like domain-containing protein [Mariprofundus micogutta]GAV20879.1 putative adenylyltransferase/sulfurtransferase MoeZ [Mariprofundus micogutta]
MAKGLMDFAAEARAKVEEISTEEVELIVGGPALFLDVREPGEVREGHLPNAVNVPRGLLEAKADLNFPHREEKLEDRDQAVIVYCASGVRSLLAAATMQEMGFTNVKSMAGGFVAWKAEGREIAGESW